MRRKPRRRHLPARRHRVQRSPKQPPRKPSEATRNRAFGAGLLLGAQDELRKALPVDEQGFRLVAGPAHRHARAFLIYDALDLVLAAAGANKRWMDLLEEMEEPSAKVDRFWVEAIVREQNTHIRPLVEALIDLIGFRSSNEDAYYRHVLLLRSLDARRSTQEDLKLFYACPCGNVAAQVERLAKQTARLEASGDLDLQKCWYLGRGTPFTAQQLASTRPGGFLASVRTRLRRALPLAFEHEKVAVGFSYDRSYSQLSSTGHFSPTHRMEADVAAVARGLSECQVVAANVIVAAQRLLDLVPGKVSKRLREAFDDSLFPTELYQRTVQSQAVVGDFVLAYGSLAEVIDVKESEFGYHAYRVLYLAEKPLPDMPEDWLPAEGIRVLFSQQSLHDSAQAGINAAKLPDDAVARLFASGDREHLRAAMVHVWEAGLRDYIRSK